MTFNDTEVNQLILNVLTAEQYKTAQADGEIDSDQMYYVPIGTETCAIENAPSNGILETNKCYSATLSSNTSFVFPSTLDVNLKNCIELYLKTTTCLTILFGDNVVVSGGDTTIFDEGYYAVFCTYHKLSNKWIARIETQGYDSKYFEMHDVKTRLESVKTLKSDGIIFRNWGV